jgi:DNA modification methylase
VSLPEPFYSRDGITIFNADCRAILPNIAPETVDLVLTDPPYGIAMDTNNSDRWQGEGGRHWSNRHDHKVVQGDDVQFDPAQLLRFDRLVLWGGNYYASRLPDSGGWIVWDKRDEMQVKSTLSEAELAWTNLANGVRVYRHKWFGLVRDSEIGKHVHPTQKPVALMRWILDRWSKPGDLILDPYAGSGPIARACLDLGRRYIGIEIEQAYVEIAVKRLQQSVLPFNLEGDAA